MKELNGFYVLRKIGQQEMRRSEIPTLWGGIDEVVVCSCVGCFDWLSGWVVWVHFGFVVLGCHVVWEDSGSVYTST